MDREVAVTSLGLLVPTWVSLQGSKPLSGASTRPRRVSVSGVLWFRRLNCRKEGDGSPVPLLHARGSAVSKAAPSRGGVALQGAATHPQSTEWLWQHRVQGCPGRHIRRHLHHITLWSTAQLWELGAGWHPQPPLPCAPLSYLHWQSGCHSAAHALVSPGQ